MPKNVVQVWLYGTKPDGGAPLGNLKDTEVVQAGHLIL